MIRAEFTEPEKEKPTIGFPVLMKSRGGSIVLFTDFTKGTVIVPHEKSIHIAGSYLTDWRSISHPGEWEKFEGTVTLSNEVQS